MESSQKTANRSHGVRSSPAALAPGRWPHAATADTLSPKANQLDRSPVRLTGITVVSKTHITFVRVSLLWSKTLIATCKNINDRDILNWAAAGSTLGRKRGCPFKHRHVQSW